MALGVGLERFESLRHDLTHPEGPQTDQKPDENKTIAASTMNPIVAFESLGFNRQIALVLTSTGAVTAVHAAFRYYQVMNQLEAGNYKPNVRGVLLVGLSCVGILASVLRSEVTRRNK